MKEERQDYFRAASTVDFSCSSPCLIRRYKIVSGLSYLISHRRLHQPLSDNKYKHFWGWSQDSSVGIATSYGLDGPGIESRCGPDFPHPSSPALSPAQPPIQWIPARS